MRMLDWSVITPPCVVNDNTDNGQTGFSDNADNGQEKDNEGKSQTLGDLIFVR